MESCDLYQAWVAARDEADDAYQGWCRAPSTERRDAYSRYVAAADREGVAGDRFARAV